MLIDLFLKIYILVDDGVYLRRSTRIKRAVYFSQECQTHNPRITLIFTNHYFILFQYVISSLAPQKYYKKVILVNVN